MDVLIQQQKRDYLIFKNGIFDEVRKHEVKVITLQPIFTKNT